MPLPYYVSPEQMMQDKAEYAKKGIAKGRSIIALEYVDGIVLAADNPSASLHKVSEVYDRIAFAGAGRYSEFEHLRKAGIRHADLTGYMYSREDVSARTLSNAYSQSLGTAFSTDVKPLEVEILVVQVGNDRHNFLQEVLFYAKVKSLDHSPTYQTAHDVTLLLIAGHATVNCQEGSSAQVVGNDTHTFGMTLVVLFANTL